MSCFYHLTAIWTLYRIVEPTFQLSKATPIFALPSFSFYDNDHRNFCDIDFVTMFSISRLTIMLGYQAPYSQPSCQYFLIFFFSI